MSDLPAIEKIYDRYSQYVEKEDLLLLRNALMDAYFQGKFDGIQDMSKRWAESNKRVFDQHMERSA